MVAFNCIHLISIAVVEEHSKDEGQIVPGSQKQKSRKGTFETKVHEIKKGRKDKGYLNMA